MDSAAPATTRYLTLDALRGFAVMGILAMNIIAFAMPEMAYISPSALGEPTRADIVSWMISFILVDGKMRGLFTLLFGASMLLIVQRAEAKEEDPARVHFARMGWLALFGLAHFFFIWWGDILFLYAAVGCVAFLFKDMEAGSLIKMALAIYAAGFLIMTLFVGGLLLLQLGGSGPGADAKTQRAYAEVMAEFSGSGAAEIALYQSGYFTIVADRLTAQWLHPFTMVLQNCLESLPFMLIGMALLKNGFMTGMLPAATYRKWAIAGILTGLAGFGFFAWLAAANNFEMILQLNIFLAWSYPFRLVMVIGYAAALILLINATANSAAMLRVAAAGRAAFTNYLGTSIVMTTIFYGYGLGLFGKVSRSELWLYVLGAWLIMLLWSKPWLTRFHYGPFEWLWRSLARWQIQPFRRR